MSDGFGLAYLNINEMPVYTTVDSTQDYTPVFDSTAGAWRKRQAGNVSTGEVAGGSALTLTAALHAGKTIKLDTAAGTTITLPAATGTGNIYAFRVSVLATSNSHIVKVANSSDTMQGFAVMSDTDTGSAGSVFMAGSTADTITLNRTTTGSVSLGEYIEITDVATNLFHVKAFLSGTGTVATPFSATV